MGRLRNNKWMKHLGKVSTRQWFVVVGIVFLFTYCRAWESAESEERRVLETVTEAGAPLIRAIEAFVESRGEPPFSLEQLVPEFIASIPDPGISILSGFCYVRQRKGGALRASMHYQLSDAPLIDGNGERTDAPCLTLRISGLGSVKHVKVPDPPVSGEVRNFDRDDWHREVAARAEMVGSIQKDQMLRGLERAEVITLLGPPDFESQIPLAPWFLIVQTDHWPADSKAVSYSPEHEWRW